MPRKKTSGLQVPTEVEAPKTRKPRVKKDPTPPPPVIVEEPKQRKQATWDTEGRIALVDATIVKLKKTIEDRKVLIAEAEDTLEKRRVALVKSEQLLAVAEEKKARIAAGGQNALNRARKTEEAMKLNELKEALAARGMTIEDVLAQLIDSE